MNPQVEWFLKRVMVWIGRKVYRFVFISGYPREKMVAFAESEREFNNAIRDEVERLDGVSDDVHADTRIE